MKGYKMYIENYNFAECPNCKKDIQANDKQDELYLTFGLNILNIDLLKLYLFNGLCVFCIQLNTLHKSVAFLIRVIFKN